MNLSKDLQTLSAYKAEPSTLNLFCQAFEAEYNFSPLGIYCIATGKRIGTMSADEIESLIGAWTPEQDDVIDDVAMRILASMRPSIQWNKMRLETLDEMRVRCPVDTLAYLLNRLFATPEQRNQPFDDRLSSYADRIALHSFLCQIDSNPDGRAAIVKALHMMIELDAKIQLDSLTAPLTAQVFIGASDRLNQLSAFYAAQVKLHDKRVKEDEANARWIKHGNPLAKRAFASVVVETRPPSQVEQRKAEKRKDARFFENLFDELTGAKTKPDSTVKPVAPKAIALPVVRLGKLNLARKG